MKTLDRGFNSSSVLENEDKTARPQRKRRPSDATEFSKISNRPTTDQANRKESNSGDESILRVGVIGCGPRGLQCLEALSRQGDNAHMQRLSVTVFEPSNVPGAGGVYDPSQSHTLRMNFANRNIDFWKSSANQQTDRTHSLTGWLSNHYPESASSGAFVPRAIVGEYMQQCFQEVTKRFDACDHFAIIPAHVKGIRHDGSQFVVETDADTFYFDEVALTTGHEGLRTSPSLHASVADIPALPANPNLSVTRVPADSRVLVRGFGLTAIDAVLTLTEARGGVFVDDGFLPRYIRCNEEPHTIELRSRSGRPMLAKPTAKVEPISDTFWTPFREQLKALQRDHGALNFHRDIWPVLAEAAADLLAQSGTPTTANDVCNWYRGWSRYTMDAATARRAMLQSYAVAIGKRPIDIPFALGDTWRRLYPELVRLVGSGGLTHKSWQTFADTAREMERIAFGPPAESVGRLLTLMRERIVTLGTDTDQVSEVDVTVNAVIAGPHELAKNGPLMQLIEAGLVETDPTCGGVMVNANGYATGSVNGLAVFGRATEGWVVGNDTLTRTLHDHIENWAQSVAASLELKT